MVAVTSLLLLLLLLLLLFRRLRQVMRFAPSPVDGFKFHAQMFPPEQIELG
eukprot:EC690783.1.p5 GENE.EC690783.1~~EC690783.1.p5  ORF type:complete len:51 (+),score=20.98 EC690783.1:238-390(+)